MPVSTEQSSLDDDVPIRDQIVPGTLEELEECDKGKAAARAIIDRFDALHVQAIKEKWTVGRFADTCENDINAALASDDMDKFAALQWYLATVEKALAAYSVGLARALVRKMALTEQSDKSTE